MTFKSLNQFNCFALLLFYQKKMPFNGLFNQVNLFFLILIKLQKNISVYLKRILNFFILDIIKTLLVTKALMNIKVLFWNIKNVIQFLFSRQ